MYAQPKCARARINVRETLMGGVRALPKSKLRNDSSGVAPNSTREPPRPKVHSVFRALCDAWASMAGLLRVSSRGPRGHLSGVRALMLPIRVRILPNKGADNQNKGRRASEPDADGDAVVRRIEANDAWQSRTARALEHLRSPRSAAQRRCRIVWDRLSHGRVSRGTSDVDDIPHDARVFQPQKAPAVQHCKAEPVA